MAVPTYDELLVWLRVNPSLMKLPFRDGHKLELASKLESCTCELLGTSLEIPRPEIDHIRENGDARVQITRMLECWKQRCGSRATYESLARALLQVNRTDLAEEVVRFTLAVQSTTGSAKITTDQTQSQSGESDFVSPPSPASSSGVEMSPSPEPLNSSPPSANPAQTRAITQTLKELQEEFFQLVTFVEDTLDRNHVEMEVLTRRFRMLPASVVKEAKNKIYTRTRRRILKSKTTKEIFDNLTQLKHFGFMMPEPLECILQDVRIDDIHQRISNYEGKLLQFKTCTKLKDVINTQFLAPDYCIYLHFKVDGWEYKTIDEAEKNAVNMIRRDEYSGHNTTLGLEGVRAGCIELTFVLIESIDINYEVVKLTSGVKHIQLDGKILYRNDGTELKNKSSNEMVSAALWYERDTTTKYSVGGGRDVLLIDSDLSHPHPEAVMRRSGQLTIEDKKKLRSQGVIFESQSDLAIVKAKHQLDKRITIVEVMSGELLSCEEVIKRVSLLLNTTKNDGVCLYYIGAGRRNTGDWCFKDGFITFSDIAQLYLKASSNMKGRVLSIVSDCSYSGCWVKDCMEFFDEQGVQPCGHKAREKGMLIKMFASCKPKEIPTVFRYSVSGIHIVANTKEVSLAWPYKHLGTQTTVAIDYSVINCNSRTIGEQCTLKPHYNWRKLSAQSRIELILAKHSGRPGWFYILLDDDDDVMEKFFAKLKEGSKMDLKDYGKILAKGWGEYPLDEIKNKIEKEYFLQFNR